MRSAVVAVDEAEVLGDHGCGIINIITMKLSVISIITIIVIITIRA